MKFTITFKNPDAVCDSLNDAACNSIAGMEDLSEEEQECLVELRIDKLSKFVSKWITYSEYITIEFDTKAGTAIVQEK
jgi:hypothetical protein